MKQGKRGKVLGYAARTRVGDGRASDPVPPEPSRPRFEVPEQPPGPLGASSEPRKRVGTAFLEQEARRRGIVEDNYDQNRLRKLTARDKALFLLLVSEGFSIARAAEELNRPRLAFGNLLENDQEFRAQYERAYEASADHLEDEAFYRSRLRADSPTASARLLEMSLKARRPSRYSERVQHFGPGGGPVQVVAQVDHKAVFEVLEAAGVVSKGPMALPEADA